MLPEGAHAIVDQSETLTFNPPFEVSLKYPRHLPATCHFRLSLFASFLSAHPSPSRSPGCRSSPTTWPGAGNRLFAHCSGVSIRPCGVSLVITRLYSWAVYRHPPSTVLPSTRDT